MDHYPPEGQLIITMNAGGFAGYCKMRKIALKHIIKYNRPAIMLIQELPGINTKWLFETDDKIFPDVSGIDHMVFSGERHSMPHILVDNKYFVEQDDSTLFQSVEMPQMSHAELQTFRSRICILILKASRDVSLIFISWHGRHNGMKTMQKLEEFKRLMIFVTNLKKTPKALPIVIGGDFNVDLNEVREHVKYPFVLYHYSVSPRQAGARVKDFFIATNDLHLFDVTFMDTHGACIFDGVQYPMTSTFDHDPIKARIEYIGPMGFFFESNVHSEETCQLCQSRQLHSVGGYQGCKECEIMQLGSLFRTQL